MQLRIAMTGFVSTSAGSVAGANALLFRRLLDLGYQIDFFSKPSFVDPRPIVRKGDSFSFFPVVNGYSDGLRRRLSRLPIASSLAARFDSRSYNRSLVARIRQEHCRQKYDLVVWLGDYAAGRVPGVPTISFAQGPPGTDARSIFRRAVEIQRLGGLLQLLKLKILASLRLSYFGLPAFQHSDHIIVGSEQSRQTLIRTFRLAACRVSSIPYAIDLEHFQPASEPLPSTSSPLRVLWLGRIVPRKRLDLLLDACTLAIKDGLEVNITVIGKIGIVKGYDELIKSFPFPERLKWTQSAQREEIPAIMRAHDVLVQPSEEEDFGSSVAEALACGIPVIVGATNGTGDYICKRSIRLNDDNPRTLATALWQLSEAKRSYELVDPSPMRQTALRWFHCDRVVERLESKMRLATELNPAKCLPA